MARLPQIVALSILVATAACDRREASPGPAAATQPAPRAAPAIKPLDPAALEALAFRAAWSGPPPVSHASTVKDFGEVRITYREGELTPLGGERYALISSGKGGESHAESGALAIHYLKRTANGFERLSAWPEFILGGTFGAAPEWTVRNDLTAAPALVTKDGGTWQGYTCEWSDVIELTPDKPVLRSDKILVGYDSNGASEDGDSGETLQGTIAPGAKGRQFVVRYGGDRTAEVAYVLADGRYGPTSDPRLPTC